MARLEKSLLALCLVATGCTKSATGPAQPTPTHPAGIVVGQATVSGAYGVAVSSTGTVFVTQLDSSTSPFARNTRQCRGRP